MSRYLNLVLCFLNGMQFAALYDCSTSSSVDEQAHLAALVFFLFVGWFLLESFKSAHKVGARMERARSDRCK